MSVKFEIRVNPNCIVEKRLLTSLIFLVSSSIKRFIFASIAISSLLAPERSLTSVLHSNWLDSQTEIYSYLILFFNRLGTKISEK